MIVIVIARSSLNRIETAFFMISPQLFFILYTTANNIVNLNIQKSNYGSGSGALRKPID